MYILFIIAGAVLMIAGAMELLEYFPGKEARNASFLISNIGMVAIGLLLVLKGVFKSKK